MFTKPGYICVNKLKIRTATNLNLSPYAGSQGGHHIITIA